ncbi:hypothetical protein GDO81_029695 [Engystomops pustulosus]|uniref:Uncharacterized protein n=1 Tax=Engystomops pustulosus TaxID=76066 RepID=A0AAV6YWI6_ENGPU|nr:hypothetical protein GDO81_029695 [Engystomops pustulosus]
MILFFAEKVSGRGPYGRSRSYNMRISPPGDLIRLGETRTSSLKMRVLYLYLKDGDWNLALLLSRPNQTKFFLCHLHYFPLRG